MSYLLNMNQAQIIIAGILLLLLIGSIYSFIITPKSEKFGYQLKDLGPEYAPLYSKAERMASLRKQIPWLIFIIPVVYFVQSAWFKNFLAHPNCFNFGLINGTHIVLYGMFSVFPLLYATILAVQAPFYIKVFKQGQYPLPNQKVFKPTKYSYGIMAKARAVFFITLTLFLFGLSISGDFLVSNLTHNIQPCAANKSFKLVTFASLTPRDAA